jgi:hypothetical protein
MRTTVMTEQLLTSDSLTIVCCNCHAVRILNDHKLEGEEWVPAGPEIVQVSPQISHGYCPECYKTIVPILEGLA